jgi:hypothetical protein
MKAGSTPASGGEEGGSMRILITEQAREEILAATRQGSRTGLEFGGSLLAHEIDDEILVVYALPTGPRAEQGPGHVRTDAAFQNAAIARVQRRCPKLFYAGDWHVHPMWLPRLSPIDEHTALGILKDDGRDRDRIVLMIGTLPPKGEPVLVGFVAQLRTSQTLDVRAVDLEIVEDGSVEVRSHLGRPLDPLQKLLADPEPMAPSHTAASRIEADLEEIRAELGAEIAVRIGDDVLGAIVRRRDREAIVLFPPEYPAGAPQVFSGSLTAGPLSPVELRYAWSSRHRLVDVIAAALAPRLAHRALSLARTVAAFAARSRRAHRRALDKGARP